MRTISLAGPVATRQGVLVLNLKKVDLDRIHRRNSALLSMVRHCNRLPREVVDVPSLEMFKATGLGL